MKNRQPTKTNGWMAGVFALLFAAGFLLLLPGCQAPIGPQADRAGTLSLTIDAPAGRTIMPGSNWHDDLIEFRLAFTSRGDADTITRDWDGQGTFNQDLAPGLWDVVITAYRTGERAAGDPAAMWDSAEGHPTGIQITAGQVFAVDGAELAPIADGEGTFSWDITFPGSVQAVRVDIAGRGLLAGFADYWTFGVADFGPEYAGTRTLTYTIDDLDAGRYLVTFTLSTPAGNAVFSEILHIWQGLESHFEDTFTLAHFPGLLLTAVLGAWDDVEGEWDFEAAGIEAGHFALLPVLGVAATDGAFVPGILDLFDDLGNEFVPTNLPELRAMVDAALIHLGIAADPDFFDGLDTTALVMAAIDTLALNDTPLGESWNTPVYDELILEVGLYTVVIDLPNPIAPSVIDGSVSIVGNAIVGETLEVNLAELVGTGAPFFYWFRYSQADPFLYGTAHSEHTLTADDLGHEIRVRVRLLGYEGERYSLWTAAVALPSLGGAVTISGDPVVGATLTANIAALVPPGAANFVWERGPYYDGDDDDFEAIPGANANTRVLTGDDEGYYVRVRVTRDGFAGSVVSNVLGPILGLPPLPAPVIRFVLPASVAWDPVPGAGGFIVTLNGTPATAEPLPATALSITNFAELPAGPYAVRVTALGVANQSSNSAPSDELVVTRLGQPAVQVTGSIVSWADIPAAAGFHVLRLVGTTVHTIPGGMDLPAGTTQFDLLPANLGAGNHTIIVQALGSVERASITSGLFTTPSAVFTIRQLYAPQNLRIEEGATLRWNAVEHALGYSVRIAGVEVAGGNLAYDVTSFNLAALNLVGGHSVTVVALGDNELVLTSPASAPITFTVAPLPAPVIDLDDTIVSWGEVAGASGYSVRIDGVEVPGGGGASCHGKTV